MTSDLKFTDDNGKCKHLHGHVFGSCNIGNAYCPDCKKEIPLYVVFENLLLKLRKDLNIKEVY